MLFVKLVISLIVVVKGISGNNFPSLLSTNATIAIIIDREYLGDNFENIKGVIENHLTFLKREKLKHGGMNIVYYYWTSINIRKEISAILTIASCKDTWKLFRIATAENILHIAISETDCPRLPTNDGFTIPSVIRGEELPQVLLDLRSIKAYDWKSVVLLYDDTLARDMVTRVLTSLTIDTKDLTVGGAAISLIKLDEYDTMLNMKNIKNALASVSSRKVGSNFLVVVSMELVSYVMKTAQTLNLLNTYNQWLYVISDNKLGVDSTSDILVKLKEGNNIAYLYNISKSGGDCEDGIECHLKELLDAFSIALDIAIVEEFDLSSQVSEEEWDAIRPTKLERRNSLLNNIKAHLLKNGRCGNCITWQIQSCDTWGIEYGSTSIDSKYSLMQVGFWRLGAGAAMTDVLFPHITHGFRGKTLELVSLHNPPWQIIERNSAGVVSFKGLVFDIINEIARALNFTYTVVAMDDGKNTLENSSYFGNTISYRVTYVIPDGIVQMIRSKKAFMVAYAYTITEESKMSVNFTAPISTQTYSLLAARPKELSRALLFMSPFTTSTWLSLLSAILTMGPILYVIYKYSPVNEYHGISMRGGLYSIYNCIWYVYGALLQQGGMYLPSADSARLVIGSWWLVVLVITTTYCGNLVAFLTFPNNNKPIRTLNELLYNKDTITWSIAPATFLEYEVKTSNEAKYQNLYHGSVQTVKNMEDMIGNIEMGRHVHIDWKLRLQYMIKKQFLDKATCDLALGIEDFFDERLGLIVAQDNPYLERINREIKRLHQVGLIDKWLKDYLPKKDRCFKSKTSSGVNNHTVNLNDMQGCFFVLFLGFVVSFLFIFCERIFYKYKKKREEKVQPFVS